MRDTNTRIFPKFFGGKNNVLTSCLLVNSFNEKKNAGVNKIQEVYSRISLT